MAIPFKRIALLVATLPVVALLLAAAAPVRGATAPPPTVTRYVVNPDPTRFYALGCSAGQSATQNGPSDGVVILDFGQPQTWDNGSTFGTYDYGNHNDSLETITNVSEQWLKGFWKCTPVNGPKVQLGIGTSNYKGATTYAHGQAWGAMVNSLNAWIVASGYGSQLSARGANDMELSWNSAVNTRAWVDGYGAVGKYPLYDYGDDEGGIHPPNGWTLDDVWYKAYGAHLNFPIPEIYYTADATQDWQPLSLWAATNKGSKIVFTGVLTQYAADKSTLTPAQGWLALYNALNSDPRTAQATLPYSLDITWAN